MRLENKDQALVRKMVVNIYHPYPASIIDVKEETPDIKTFTLSLKDQEIQEHFDFRPGQFVLLSVFDCGEAPFSICSSPTLSGHLQLSIKKVGHLTGEVHCYNAGHDVGLRGPYGNGFPVDDLRGQNLLFVGGGIGLAPLRSLIQYVVSNRSEFEHVTVLYGSRTAEDLVFKDDLAAWVGEEDFNVVTTVDRGDQQWKGDIGPVTHLWNKVRIHPSNTKAIICGPPVMISYVVFDLLKMGFAEHDIITTLERHMKCGIGKCGHCSIGGKFTCIHGPVFEYQEIKKFPSVL